MKNIFGTILVVMLCIVPLRLASAAELTAVADARCDHLLSGDIEANDADLFNDVHVTRLCLNSPGGSFLGGKALQDLFMSDGIPTYVRRGDECHSACALAFLGGSEWGDMRHASRTLEPGAVLGFHAPFLALPPGKHDAEELNQTATTAMAIAGQVVAVEPDLKITLGFLTGFVLHPSRSTKVVITVHDAIMGGIEIDTAYKFPKLGKEQARQACKTLFDRYTEAFADAVTATEPNFEIEPDGEFAKALLGKTEVDGERWLTVATINSEETPWQSAACAFSDKVDSWGLRDALIWSNSSGSEPDLKSAIRKVELRIPHWYFLPGQTPLSTL